jgi:hypothetical protein
VICQRDMGEADRSRHSICNGSCAPPLATLPHSSQPRAFLGMEGRRPPKGEPVDRTWPLAMPVDQSVKDVEDPVFPFPT